MAKIIHDSEILAEGQQVITACAFIHQKFGHTEKVFLPKRAKTKKFLPDVFELPGGHIDFGERLEDGLAREIMEEIGMEVRIGDPFYAFSYVNEIKGSHSLELIYFAVFIDPIDNIKLNPEDHSEFVWISKDEISKLYNEEKGEDDIEFMALKRGFELLSGGSLNLG